MQSFKNHTKAVPYRLNEGSFRDTVTKIKRVWTTLKRAIARIFNKALKKADIGEEVSLTIPGQFNESIFNENGEIIMEGALQAIKGNYNEALVLQYIYNWTQEGVDIAKKYEKHRSDINQAANKWGGDLKNKVKSNYKTALRIIEKGSEDMTRYLVYSALEEDATIIGGYLDNLSFQTGGIESKADIQLYLLKEGKVILQGYSLKLYSNKSVGLANTTAAGLAGHLGGSKAEDEVVEKIKTDKELSRMIIGAGLIDKIKQDHKKHLKGDINATNRLMTLRAPRISGSDEEKTRQIKALDQKALEKERRILREPINPRVAKIVYDVIKPYSNTPEFGENILKMLGFTDKDTKMLMSVSTEKKSLILDDHPDLDVSHITLEHVGVSIKVVGPTGKTIVSFGVKEGERKAIAGKVSFADVVPVDLAKAPLFKQEK